MSVPSHAVLDDELIFQFFDDQGRPTVELGWNVESDPGWPRFGHQMVRLCNGMVLISGGAAKGSTLGGVQAVVNLEVFNPL